MSIVAIAMEAGALVAEVRVIGIVMINVMVVVVVVVLMTWP